MHRSSVLSSLLTAIAMLSTIQATPVVDARYEFTQVHMGMPVRLVLYAPDDSRARDAAVAAFASIAALERIFSDYQPDSEVSRLSSRHDEFVPVSVELFTLLSRALEIAQLTGGAFDPTVGPLVALWRDTRRTATLPDQAAIDAARARVGWTLIDLDAANHRIRLRKPGMRLDFGGIAKGYILQAAVRTLAGRRITRVVLEAGGDIVAGDPPPGRDGWRIELPTEAAIDAAFARRASSLANAALATSGPTFQFVEINGVRYSHVVDPRHGTALTHNRVARVIAADAATADALATALTVADPNAVPVIMTRFPDVMVAIATR